MSTPVAPLQTILSLNTRLFNNCLAGVSDELAGHIVAERTNTMIFIAVHLLDARFFMLDTAGSSMPHPFPEIASAHRVEDIRTYPLLTEIRRSWDEVSHALTRCLETLSPEALQATAPRRFPVCDRSVLGALSFLLQHESYHIGQLSLLRRIHGLTAMRYTTTASGA